MGNSKLNKAMKEMRDGKTQEQMASQLNTSRELVSKYENGRSKIQPDISRVMMKMNDYPPFAIALRNEYTGTGAVWLDGPNVDLHHASVKEKAIEEMEEALTALRDFNFARPLKSISSWEHPEIHRVLGETVDAITALETAVAIICKGLDISFTDTWQTHYTKLQSKGYVQI